jgi:hypothetical protein
MSLFLYRESLENFNKRRIEAGHAHLVYNRTLDGAVVTVPFL